MAITLFSGAFAGYIALTHGDTNSEILREFESKLSWIFSAGAAAIIALLGIRGASPDCAAYGGSGIGRQRRHYSKAASS
jgi:hypothetical protein